MKQSVAISASAIAMALIGSFTPNAFAATATPSVSVKIIDNDIALVIGNHFTPGNKANVSVAAGTDMQTASSTVQANGRFTVSTFLPVKYSGPVKATVAAGTQRATGIANSDPIKPVAPKVTQASGQKLGVGGVATPADAIKSTADTTSDLNIKDSGTQAAPKVYDGQGHTVGTINIRANWVVVQNFKIRATGQYGINSKGTHITVQNNDIKGVHTSGDGDLNAITFQGDYHSFLYNTAINFVTGDAGSSHTDAIQTWNDDPGKSSSNILIKGNRFEGPPSEGASTYIHQGIMCEGKDSTDGGGGGTGATQNWLVDGNYFVADLKFDDCDNVTVTRNTFASNDKAAVVVTSLSTGFQYYSDNKITGKIGKVGADVKPGAGPTKLW